MYDPDAFLPGRWHCIALHEEGQTVMIVGMELFAGTDEAMITSLAAAVVQHVMEGRVR